MNPPLPGFFKVYLLPTCSENLLLPLALVAHMRGALPVHTLLRNHRGKVWPVKITKVRNKLYFTDDWAKYVEDNNIQDRDFLVFDHDGSDTFDVKIYGNTACEKKLAESSEDESENDEVAEGDVESTEYEESEDDEESEEETEESTEDESDESYEEDEQFEEEEEFEMKPKSAKRLRMSIASSDGKQLCVAKNHFGNKGSSSAGLAMVKISTWDKGKDSAKVEGESSDASEDEDKVFRHGIIARPKNPYFVTKLRKRRTNELYVPTDVIRDNNLEFPEKITILDERNREWKSKVKKWKDGRTWLTKGWKAFRKWNDLRWEDRCLCEFVKETGPRGLHLKIRILRAGSWC